MARGLDLSKIVYANMKSCSFRMKKYGEIKSEIVTAIPKDIHPSVTIKFSYGRTTRFRQSENDKTPLENDPQTLVKQGVL